MMLKPEQHKKSQMTSLSDSVKKPLSLIRFYTDKEIDNAKPLSSYQKDRLENLLHSQLNISLSKTIDFIGPPPWDDSSSEQTDDRKILDNWLASYNPIPNNVSWLNNPKSRIRNESCTRVRNIKKTKHSNLLDYVWESTNKTKGWWGERPPTLDQLFSNSKKIAENFYYEKLKRKDRIEELKAKMRDRRQAANDESMTKPLNKGDLFVLKYEQECLEEKKRYDKWLGIRQPNMPKGITYSLGLKFFFQSTGVPKNNLYPYKDYWSTQALASWEYTPEQLLHFNHLKCDEIDYYERWSKNSTEEDRLHQWLANNEPLNGHFIPDKPYKKCNSQFKRKMKAYMMAIDRIDEKNQASIDRVYALYDQLFKSKTTNYLSFTNRKFYPIVAVGEPYDDYDLEEKKELIRESNRTWAELTNSSTNKNTGKVWPNLGLPNRRKPSKKDEELSLRITNRIFSEENVRNIIQEEMKDTRDLIRTEMEDFTVSLVSEFETAMEDCIEKIVDNAISQICLARTPMESKKSKEVKGFSRNDSGILLPN